MTNPTNPPNPNMPLLFLDGGMGTYLEDAHSVHFTHDSHPAWSSSVSPSVLSQVHAAYAEHSDILLTATYQACVANMQPSDHDAETPSSITAARARMRGLVSLCKSAAASSAPAPSARSIALSLGAYGATMHPSTEYSGAYPDSMVLDPNALHEWHFRRLLDYTGWNDGKSPQAPLSQAYHDVEYIAFETLVSCAEVHAVRRAINSLDEELEYHAVMTGVGDEGLPNVPKWWVSVNYPRDDSSGQPVSPVGEGPGKVAEAMLKKGPEGMGEARPWGVGVNCTKVSRVEKVVESYEARVEEIMDTESRPNHKRGRRPWLVLYPDGAQNLVYNTETKAWDETEELTQDAQSWAAQMEHIVRRIVERGKWSGIVVGGCCKTTPDDIADLRERMASTQQQ